MNLEGYLKKNTVISKQEKIHSSFVEVLCNNIENIGINPPYEIFKEVRLRDPKKEEEEDEPKSPKLINKDSYRQSDLIILNSDLYIIEATVIRKDKQKGKRVRNLRDQLKAGYSFFKRNFRTKPILIGAYKRLNSNHFNFYHQNPDGTLPRIEEILQISC